MSSTDLVYCKVCGAGKSILTVQHFKLHGMSQKEYLVKFKLNKEDLKSVAYINKVKMGLKNSEKHQNRLRDLKENGLTDEVKRKISKKVKQYYSENDNPMLGKKRPDLSLYNKTRSWNPMDSKETREKIRKKLIGQKRTKETKEKMSKAMRGHKWSEESKKNFSERLKHSGARKGKNNPIYGTKMSNETKSKISKTKAGTLINSHWNIKGSVETEYGKIPYRSSLEKSFIEYIGKVPTISSVKYECLDVPYTDMGVIRRTIPDFFIVLKNGLSLIIETKGSYFLERSKKKIEAVKRFCLDNMIEYYVVTEKDMLNEGYLKKIFRQA